ncbi:MAG TPA: DUF6792 domain-containing protein, partial [Bacillaceae bacterium]
DLLITRIAQLEYKNITIEEIKRIYVEEKGYLPPGEIILYKSKDLNGGGKDTGFDGTIIHFYSPDKGINQVYTITRGSELFEEEQIGQSRDWPYNIFGIFTGQITNQFEQAYRFERHVSNQINNYIKNDLREKKTQGNSKIVIPELRKFGIGHSLGGNLIQMLQINHEYYEKIYAINDAPPTAYQLAYIDRDFMQNIEVKFRIDPDDPDQLYSIPPDQLKAFGEEYYRDRGANIHHLTAEEDMLYSVLKLRGFLDLGHRTVIDTDPTTDGIQKYTANLSDSDIRQFQQLLGKLAPAYEKGGTFAAAAALLGIDENFVNSLKRVGVELDKYLRDGSNWKSINFRTTYGPGFIQIPIWASFSLPDDLIKALADLVKWVPAQYDHLMEVKESLKSFVRILGQMAIPAAAKFGELIMEIQTHLNNITAILSELKGLSARDLISLNPFTIIKTAEKLFKTFFEIQNEVDAILGKIPEVAANLEEMTHDFKVAIDAHGLEHVSNSLAGEGRSYAGNDLIRTKGKGSGQIRVNLSSAVRVYQIGMDHYEQKDDVIKKLQRLHEREYIDDFHHRKSRIMNKIHAMESSPRSYSHLLPGSDKEITGISVHEHFPPLPAQFHQTLDEMFQYYAAEKEKGRKLLHQIRHSIEELFKEDASISAIFDLR